MVEGHAAADESTITGESLPVDWLVGDAVIGATVNAMGSFKFRGIKVGMDNVLTQGVLKGQEAMGSMGSVEFALEAAGRSPFPVPDWGC